jgi:hypothetical protein
MEESDDLDDDIEVTQAFLMFHDYFSTYVKEMDPELWRRAVDYAVSFTETDSLRLKYSDDCNGTTSGGFI